LVPAGFSARAISAATEPTRLLARPAHRFYLCGFSEEWGLAGCLILLVLYFALIVYSFRLIERAKDRFGGLLVFGMVAIFFWHVVINVAMVTGIMPVVGVPLPMVSYGGSSLASMMFALGVMINVSMRRYTF
jgi:rod shape determining protein RodA